MGTFTEHRLIARSRPASVQNGGTGRLPGRAHVLYLRGMSKMPRSAFSTTVAQKAWIVTEAARLGISESELIRRVIDGYRVQTAGPGLAWTDQHREWLELVMRTVREQEARS